MLFSINKNKMQKYAELFFVNHFEHNLCNEH